MKTVSHELRTAMLTAYVLDRDGKIWEISLSHGDFNDGVSIVDHMDFVFERMIGGDELLNVVFH